MCLAVPAEVITLLPHQMAEVALDGVIKQISVALIDDISVGDYVVVHVGHALAKIDAEEAAETLAMLRELAAAGAAEPSS